MHILITGDVGVGKSTLIGRLLRRVQEPVYGFRTEKVKRDAQGSAVYIHPATGEKSYSDDNIAATFAPFEDRGEDKGTVLLSRESGRTKEPSLCLQKPLFCITGAFDELGVSLLAGIPAGSVVLMDELGFMESKALRFCDAVMAVLDGSYYGIAAVKPMNTPFLEKVRSHKDALVFEVTKSNRDELYEKIMQDLRHSDPESPFLRYLKT